MADSPEVVQQSDVLLHRKDIVKFLNKHYSMYQQIKGDISLIAQTYAKAGKEEYCNIILSYLDCVQVCEDLLMYVQDCMQMGIEGAKQERNERIENTE